MLIKKINAEYLLDLNKPYIISIIDFIDMSIRNTTIAIIKVATITITALFCKSVHVGQDTLLTNSS